MSLKLALHFLVVITALGFASTGEANEDSTLGTFESAVISRDGGLFRAEFSFSGDWTEDDARVSLLNETIQIDLANARYAKGRRLINLDDPVVKSVLITDLKPNIVRIRATLNKNLSPKAFKEQIHLSRDNGILALNLEGHREQVAAYKGKTEGTLVNNLKIEKAVTAEIPTVDPISEAMKGAKLTAGAAVAATPEKNSQPVKVDANLPVSESKSTAGEKTTIPTAPLKESEVPLVSTDATQLPPGANLVAAGTATENSEASRSKEKTADGIRDLPESQIPVQLTPKTEAKVGDNPILRLLMSLGVVLVVLVASTFAIKKYSKRANSVPDTAKIRVLAQHHLGPKKSLAVVQIAGESMLIGITDNSINLLRNLSLLEEEIPMEAPRDFSRALKGMFRGEPEEQPTRQLAASPTGDPNAADDFAMAELSKIRDVVSHRLQGMRRI